MELFQRFNHYSRLAMKQEKAGDYVDAASNWKVAALSASKAINQDWAKQRARSCEYWASKPSHAPECRPVRQVQPVGGKR